MAQKRHTPGSSEDLSRWQKCPDCASPDPHVRARHQMDLAQLGGLDEVRSHLTEQYVTMRDPDRARPDVVDDVCNWLATLMNQYSGMADERTGAPIHWWEMRQRMTRESHKAVDEETEPPEKLDTHGPSESVGDIIRRHIEKVQAEEALARRPIPKQGDGRSRTPEERIFQTLMFELIDRSTGRWQDALGTWHAKLTLEGRSTQCYEWMNQYAATNPELAEELRYQAKTYGDMNVTEQARKEREKAHART